MAELIRPKAFQISQSQSEHDLQSTGRTFGQFASRRPSAVLPRPLPISGRATGFLGLELRFIQWPPILGRSRPLCGRSKDPIRRPSP